MIYLGGVFYSVHLLPDWGVWVTYANPMFYLVDAFRWGAIGYSETHVGYALAGLGVMAAILLWLSTRLFYRHAWLQETA